MEPGTLLCEYISQNKIKIIQYKYNEKGKVCVFVATLCCMRTLTRYFYATLLELVSELVNFFFFTDLRLFGQFIIMNDRENNEYQ